MPGSGIPPSPSRGQRAAACSDCHQPGRPACRQRRQLAHQRVGLWANAIPPPCCFLPPPPPQESHRDYIHNREANGTAEQVKVGNHRYTSETTQLPTGCYIISHAEISASFLFCARWGGNFASIAVPRADETFPSSPPRRDSARVATGGKDQTTAVMVCFGFFFKKHLSKVSDKRATYLARRCANIIIERCVPPSEGKITLEGSQWYTDT